LPNLYNLVDGVELVSWPDEAARLDELRDRRLPRLLLVAADSAPPAVDDELEDWVRLPADPRDVEVRACRLAHVALHAVTRTRDTTRGVRA
jgi:hypothetical protein